MPVHLPAPATSPGVRSAWSRCAGAALAVLTVLSACGAPAERTPKVLVIGIDGVRPDVLADVATPNLDALADAGVYTDRARTTLPTVSGPAWSSMLTGVWPDKHGVTDNAFTGKRYEEYPGFLTRIEHTRPELGTYAVADWLPLVATEEGPTALGDEIDVRHALDGYELGWAEADQRSVDHAVAHLGAADPAALFVYLGNPDETSHRHSSIGEEYRGAIELADRHVGQLVEAVRARAEYAREDWLILSSTDHGRRADGGHGGDSPEERTIYFLAHGPSVAVGEALGAVAVVDVAATALAHLGMETERTWRLDGRPVGLLRPESR